MVSSTTGGLVHRGLAWLFIFLAFVGWVLILSGVASLQATCNKSLRTLVQQAPVGAVPTVGTVGYLAPVGCDKFFSYTWWIMAFDLFLLGLLALGAATMIGTLRGAMVATSATLLVLLITTANTYLYFNEIEGLPGPVPSRARVLTAGAIISCIAYFCLIAILGWHNEDVVVQQHYDAEAAGKKPRSRGLFAGLFGGRKKGEEEAGAGTAGSPRMVLPPKAGPAWGPGGSPAGGAPARPGAAYAPGATTTTTTTTVTGGAGAPVVHGPVAYTVAPTVPVSAPAVPISAPAAPIGTGGVGA